MEISLNTIEIILIIVFITIISFIVLTLSHHRKIKNYLLKEIPLDKATENKYREFVGIETVSAVGVNLFDVLYNTSRMDPFVLKGIDHLHHSHNFSNLGEMVDFLKENIIKSDQGTTAWRRMIHKYKGYTGEEQGFDKIRNGGDSINVPESGTNPNIDATVNGKEYDFAITDNPKYVQQKLDADPDKFVWTNKEMQNAFGENPRVHVDPELSSQDAFHLTDNTFDGIENLGDFIDQVPLITLAVSSTRNIYGVVKGNKNVATAIEHTALDTAGVGVGGFAGGKIGLAIGLALSPATGGASAIIIPAATTLIASIIGVFTGKGITNWFKERHLRKALEELGNESVKLNDYFIKNYSNILGLVKDSYSPLKNKIEFARINSESWYKRTFFPSPITKFYSLAKSRLSKELQNILSYYDKLKTKCINVESKEGGLILYAQGETIFKIDPTLLAHFNQVDKATKQIEVEKKKLK